MKKSSKYLRCISMDTNVTLVDALNFHMHTHSNDRYTLDDFFIHT